MTCLPLNLNAVLTTFGKSLTAWELGGTRQTDGTWTGTVENTRFISAVVLAAKAAELQLIAPGESLGAGIVVQTTAVLHFQTVTDRLQSFVTYQGFTWRILGTGLMTPNAGYNLYYATRYTDSGSDTA
jgi:hypothetical protein